MTQLGRLPAFGIRAAAAAVSGIPGARRLAVLTYHRVPDVPDAMLPDEPDASVFDRQMAVLKRCFRVIPLVLAVEQLRRGALPARAVCVTFDDGYADNVDVALPILQKWDIPATFFIATGFLSGGMMWNDRIIESLRRCALPRLDLRSLGLGQHDLTAQHKVGSLKSLLDELKYRPFSQRQKLVDAVVEQTGVDLPSRLMMSHDQVRKLYDGGMEVGAHTVNHPILAALTDREAEQEITESRRELEGITGGVVRTFAYPNGRPGTDYNMSHVDAVRDAGFEVAVSTAWGSARMDSDPLQLPRVTGWGADAWKFGARVAKSFLDGPAKRAM